MKVSSCTIRKLDKIQRSEKERWGDKRAGDPEKGGVKHILLSCYNETGGA